MQRKNIKDTVEKAKEDTKKALDDYNTTKALAEKANEEVKKSAEEIAENIDMKRMIDIERARAEQEANKVSSDESEEEKPKSPVKARPQTPANKEDYERKESQRPKFDKIRLKTDAKKDEAAQKFKDGDYINAIKLYKQTAELLDAALEDFPLFKKEISQLEGNVYNNIAFCYGKDQQDKQQVEYSTKVIDRALYLEDINVLIKAYLRRGLAYEHMEKYKLASNDLYRVRELQPANKQAQQALQRCLKYIEEDEGIKYIPEQDDTPLPEIKDESKPAQAEK